MKDKTIGGPLASITFHKVEFNLMAGPKINNNSATTMLAQGALNSRFEFWKSLKNS